MHLPVGILTAAGHDDGLFFNNALNIINGKWLGPYSQMTLAKGPGFPLFLAGNWLLGVPITFSIAIFYILSCIYLIFTLRQIGLNSYLAAILFIVLLFHPNLFPTRIIRDNIYPALTLYIIAGVIRLFLVVDKSSITNTIFLGVVFSLFWITREEGIWIFPGIILLLILNIIRASNKFGQIKIDFYKISLIFAICFIPLCILAYINKIEYGKFEIVDITGKAFERAWYRLLHTDVNLNRPYMAVPYDKRKVLYQISPHFALLENYFEAGSGKKWLEPGCTYYPSTCGDYETGWMMWALRDGVAEIGYYKNPKKAAHFYNKITKEINEACLNGLVPCTTSFFSMMPHINFLELLKEFPKSLYAAIRLVFMIQAKFEALIESMDPLERLNQIRIFLGYPKTTISHREKILNLSGWLYSPNKDWISLTCSTQNITKIRKISRESSPDLATHFNDIKANNLRFNFHVHEDDNCSIFFQSAPNKKFNLIELYNEKKQQIVANKNILYFDDIHLNQNNTQSKPYQLKYDLFLIYSNLMPLLGFLGLISYLISIFRIPLGFGNFTVLLQVTSMIWCLILTRIAILALIDLTSFPAILPLYLLPTFPLSVMAGVLSIICLFKNKV